MTATAILTEPKPEGYLRGVLLVGAAGLVWSLGGLFFRMVEEAGIWQVVAWRTGFLCVSMLAFVLWRYRGKTVAAFTRMGRWGIIGALGIGAANTVFMFSLQHTYVANTLLMLSASPILSALIAWVLLRERVRRATLIAMLAVAVGVAVMVSGGLGTDRWLGDVLALVTVTAFAFVVIAVRAGRNVDMMPCVALGGFLACCFSTAMVFVQGETLAVSTNDLFWCAMMGVVQITGGMVLFIIGSRNLPAAELALLSLTEVICGPIWVWLVIGELPVQATFWGGAIVLAAMVGNALSGMRRRHPLPQV
jgi:drug/metabolite transporter, DME family